MLIRDWNSDVCSSDLGNNSSAREITLTPYTPPILQLTALAAPERAVRGQKFHLEYTVTNAGGATPSLQGRWDDLIYLSRDPFLDLTSDRYLGSVRHSGGLAADDTYDVALDLAVPTALGTDTYFILVVPATPRSAATRPLFHACPTAKP